MKYTTSYKEIDTNMLAGFYQYYPKSIFCKGITKSFYILDATMGFLGYNISDVFSDNGLTLIPQLGQALLLTLEQYVDMDLWYLAHMEYWALNLADERTQGMSGMTQIYFAFNKRQKTFENNKEYLTDTFYNSNIMSMDVLQDLSDKNETKIVVPEEQDPSWYPGQFPITPGGYMGFIDGNSFYIPNGTKVLIAITRRVKHLGYFVVEPATTFLQKYLCLCPLRFLSAYGRGNEYPIPHDEQDAIKLAKWNKWVAQSVIVVRTQEQFEFLGLEMEKQANDVAYKSSVLKVFGTIQ